MNYLRIFKFGVISEVASTGLAQFAATKKGNGHVVSPDFRETIRIHGLVSMNYRGDLSDKRSYPKDLPNPQFRSKVLEPFGAARLAQIKAKNYRKLKLQIHCRNTVF